MERPPAPTGITQADWERTPVAVLRFFLGEMAALHERVAHLEEQLRQHSRSSSQPPSADPPHAPARPRAPPSGRKAGGQPGHPGAGRPLKPTSAVDRVEIVRASWCARCGRALVGVDPAPVRHQVTEIPAPRAETVEYQLHRLACPCCGGVTVPALPPGVPRGAFGPRLQAIVSLLGGLSWLKIYPLASCGALVGMV